jgi:hypothetical protein
VIKNWRLPGLWANVLTTAPLQLFKYKMNYVPNADLHLKGQTTGHPISFTDEELGCQMVCFQTKNPNWGKFWRALDCKMLVYFVAIWNFLW